MGLEEAVFAGDAAEAERALRAGADAKARTTRKARDGYERWDDAPLLTIAASRNDVAMLSLLLDHGAEIDDPTGYSHLDMFGEDYVDEPGHPPLHYAIERGHLAAVRLLLERGARRSGELLHVAVQSGQTDIVRDLLARGMIPNERISGKTALDTALWTKNAAMISLLREAGATTDQAHWSSELRDAARLGSLPGLRAALEHAELDGADRDGRTALMYAAGAGLCLGPAEERVACAEALLDRGATLELRDAGGRTAYTHSVADGQLEMLDFLTTRGASLGTVTSLVHALVRAATQGHEAAIERVLDRARAEKDRGKAIFDRIEQLAPEVAESLVELLPQLARGQLKGLRGGLCGICSRHPRTWWWKEGEQPPERLGELVHVDEREGLRCCVTCRGRYTLDSAEVEDWGDPYCQSYREFHLWRSGPGPIDVLRRLELATLVDEGSDDARAFATHDLAAHLVEVGATGSLLALVGHQTLAVRRAALEQLRTPAAARLDLEPLVGVLSDHARHDDDEDVQSSAGVLLAKRFAAHGDLDRLRSLATEGRSMAKFMLLGVLNDAPAELRIALRAEVEAMTRDPRSLTADYASGRVRIWYRG